MKRLDEIKKRLSEATPGPWWDDSDEMLYVRSKERTIVSFFSGDWGQETKGNHLFIAHSRQDIEDLVKCVEVMREALKEVSGEHGETTQKGFERKVDEKTAKEALATVEEILR